MNLFISKQTLIADQKKLKKTRVKMDVVETIEGPKYPERGRSSSTSLDKIAEESFEKVDEEIFEEKVDEVCEEACDEVCNEIYDSEEGDSAWEDLNSSSAEEDSNSDGDSSSVESYEFANRTDKIMEQLGSDYSYDGDGDGEGDVLEIESEGFPKMKNVYGKWQLIQANVEAESTIKFDNLDLKFNPSSKNLIQRMSVREPDVKVDIDAQTQADLMKPSEDKITQTEDEVEEVVEVIRPEYFAMIRAFIAHYDQWGIILQFYDQMVNLIERMMDHLEIRDEFGWEIGSILVTLVIIQIGIVIVIFNYFTGV